MSEAFTSNQPVKNVQVSPYFDTKGGGIGPVRPVVYKNGVGVYDVGSFLKTVWWKLDLSSGVVVTPLQLHAEYQAIGQLDDGSFIQMHPMTCVQAGSAPQFAATQTMPATIHPGSGTVDDARTPPFVVLGPLVDITVTQVSPAAGVPLIVQATGNIIASKVGTPHVMGVQVRGGDRVGPLKLGMARVMVTGRAPDGTLVTMRDLVCTDAGNPAVFFHQPIAG